MYLPEDFKENDFEEIKAIVEQFPFATCVANIGNDFEISINDLAKRVITETSSKSTVVYVPYQEAYGDGFEDMERRVPNIDLINQLVGWNPQRNLSTIISDISADMKKHS